MREVLVDTEDLGEAEAVISANFAKVRLGASADATSTRTQIVRSRIGSTNIDNFTYSFGFGYDMEPPEVLLLTRIRNGGIIEHTRGAESHAFGAGHVMLFGAVESGPVSGEASDGQYDVIAIDRRHLDEAVGFDALPVVVQSSAPISAKANRHLVDVIDHIVGGVAGNPDVAGKPLIAGAVSRYLAASVLAAFPSSVDEKAAGHDRSDSTPVLLRRAMAFVDENAHTDISLADIASTVFLTPRALQYMFRRHRDCSPMEYVREVRLSYARRDLLDGQRTNTSVAHVARRWGFGHLGRFAVYYRATYGESPHVTLRGTPR